MDQIVSRYKEYFKGFSDIGSPSKKIVNRSELKENISLDRENFQRFGFENDKTPLKKSGYKQYDPNKHINGF